MRLFKISSTLITFIILAMALLGCDVTVNINTTTTTNNTTTSISTTSATTTNTTAGTTTATTEEPLSITVSEQLILVKHGEDKDILFQTNDPKGVTFYSKNENIASVSTEGKITAITIGITEVEIISNTNPDYKVTINVSVTPPNAIAIIIRADITHVEVNRSIEFRAEVRPNLASQEVIWSSRNDEVATVDQNGIVTGVKEGSTVIIATSKTNPSIKGERSVQVNPYTPTAILITNPTSPLIVGNELSLQATIIPKSEEKRPMVWSSSDESIATVNQSGVITALGAGDVTITAKLADEETVTSSIVVRVYEKIDGNNIFGLFMIEQILNLDFYKFTAYGYTHIYEHSTYRSVSNYYFKDITITEDFIPLGSYNRPGKMRALPSTVTPYNDKNIYWVVVHDTGDTKSTATSIAMANYVKASGTQVSWHYSVDDTNIVQHLPDDERGYHAGDGSSSVGSGNYSGGGNSNGIGIEMSINEGSDIFRTWQRTAKLVAQLLVEHNLPLENYKYHIDFSGKICPQTLIRANLRPVFEKMVATEYMIAKNFSDAQIIFKSNNPEYLDDAGRIIKFPTAPITITYDITITKNGVTETRTFDAYLKPVN